MTNVTLIFIYLFLKKIVLGSLHHSKEKMINVTLNFVLIIFKTNSRVNTPFKKYATPNLNNLKSKNLFTNLKETIIYLCL